MTPSSNASRSRYSSSVRPGATPCAAMRRRGPPQPAAAIPTVRRAVRAVGREARQDRRAGLRPECAALGDLDCRGERFRQIGKQFAHFGAGLEAMLRRHAPAVGLANHAALRDADQRIVRFVIVGGCEKRLVGRDQRNALVIGEVDQLRFAVALGGKAVALQLDIEAVVEQPRQRLAARCQQVRLAVDGWPDRARPTVRRSSAIRPPQFSASMASLRCGRSVAAADRETRARIAASGCGSPPRSLRAEQAAADARIARRPVAGR